jgi:hypothetical protein
MAQANGSASAFATLRDDSRPVKKGSARARSFRVTQILDELQPNIWKNRSHPICNQPVRPLQFFYNSFAA